MKSPVEIIEVLNKILAEKEPVRTELINDFQNKVFNDEGIQDEALEEIAGDLALDLDFYEPNEELRKQDSSFYGSERLEEIIKTGIIKIEKYSKAVN
jgi:hypothetical protein